MRQAHRALSVMANSSKKKDMASHYKVLFTLGQGTFGTVRLAWHLKTEALVAIKTVELSKKTIRGIRAEIAALEKVHHPNIICLFQILTTSRHVNLVTEYIPGGNLFEIIQEDGPLPEEEAQKLFGQVVSAVKYLHCMDLVHQDIKPQNILRDEDGNAKLIDFGLATKCRSGTLLKRQCGTRSCFAPELVVQEPYDGKKSDVWSLGVVLYFINTGHYPFRGSTIKEMEEKITTGTYEIPPHVSGPLENLIHQMLTVSPEMRPSIAEIENHPWVKKSEVKIPTMTEPDYHVIGKLGGMGFNENEILESLHNKKYNESMGAYLILKAKVDKGLEQDSTLSAKTADQCPTPPPSPAHPSVSGLPLKRRASEPNVSLIHIRPSGEQGPDALVLSVHKVARSVSLPPMALLGTEETSSNSSCALSSAAVAAPCVCASILEDITPLPPDEEQDVKTSSPPQKVGCFKRMRKRIGACLARLCCFPRAQKTKRKHTSSKKGAPEKEARGRSQ